MAQPRFIHVQRHGAIARETLAGDGEVRVIAAFERCFYLAAPHGIACIGTSAIGAGPIHVEIPQAALISFAALGIVSGAEGRLDDGVLAIGEAFRLAVTTGETWEPPPMPVFRSLAVQAGIARVRSLARERLPGDGLGSLVLALGYRPRTATERAADEPLAHLRRELAAVLAADAWTAPARRAATLLVGLGPGFTPAGDDLLAGLMLALTAGRRAGLRDSLWATIAGELDALTTPPSAMHLSAAADGMAVEAIHALLNGILDGGGADLPAALERVAAIGHTSGWDALAGIVLGLDALVGEAAT